MICQMFGDECPFCSEEIDLRVVRASDIKTGKPVVIRDEKALGPFCNNHPLGKTGWIAEMHYCPARWGKTRPVIPLPVKPKRGRPRGSVAGVKPQKRSTARTAGVRTLKKKGRTRKAQKTVKSGNQRTKHTKPRN